MPADADGVTVAENPKWDFVESNLTGSFTYDCQRVKALGDLVCPRAGHASVCVGANVYVFGGREGNAGVLLGQYLNDLYLFDTEKDAWSLLECQGTAPPARAGHTLVEHKNKLYVFGGYCEKSDLNDCWQYDIEKKSWKSVCPLPGDGRYGHTAVVYNDVMYIYAGHHDADCLGDVWYMDLNTLKEWKEMSYAQGDAPKARDGHTAVLYKNFMYTFGGYHQLHNMADTWRLNLDTCVWQQIQTLGDPPCGRYSHSGASVNDTWLIQGGYSLGVFRNDLHEYDFTKNLWRRIATTCNVLPRVCYHTCVHMPAKNRVYIFGGLSGGDRCECCQDLFVLTPIAVDKQEPLPNADAFAKLMEAYEALKREMDVVNREKTDAVKQNDQLKHAVVDLRNEIDFYMDTVSNKVDKDANAVVQ